MTFAKPLLLAAALAVTSASAHAAPIYADSVVSFTKGKVTKKGVVGRSDPTTALGAPDDNFVSLGLGGSIVLGFAKPFMSMGEVFEITFGDRNNHKESASLYVGNGAGWTLVAMLKNTLPLVFSFSGIFTQVKIVDTTKGGPSFDGFDVDSVMMTAVPAPVPLPASGLLLGGAVLGLGALRRRAKKKTA